MIDPITKPFPHNILRREIVEYPEDVVKEYEDYNAEEAWVYSITASVEEIIKKYGVEFFIDKLPRYSKIALIAWKQKNATTSGCNGSGD
jgi:hypothetical protein